ncbi:hypothetical protein FB45DRAFT_864326 [Roridomyces roridus]|uniref:Uncharacterized protein n=1 Tax=Roridomyces roridus TaxID=1738132 RepID=A0AAD7C2M9_9AGAR|nr:hypothetical protein FB45DRAFT_864326 [Roridomyces roridus]
MPQERAGPSLTRTLKRGFKASDVSARAPQALDGALTNAQRLARGLPLLKPRPRKLRAISKSTPSAPRSGPRGWWFKQSMFYGKFEGFTQTQSDGTALVVSFSYTPGSTSHFPMLASTTAYGQYPYMAAIISVNSESNDLSSTSTNFAYFGKSGYVPEGPPVAGAPSSHGDAMLNTHLGVETALWSYDPITRGLTPTWINSNGDSISPTIFWNYWAASFYISGASSSNVFPGGGIPMTFTCVDPVPISG